MANMSYEGLISKLTLQDANIATYAADIGATAGEIAEVITCCSGHQW